MLSTSTKLSVLAVVSWIFIGDFSFVQSFTSSYASISSTRLSKQFNDVSVPAQPALVVPLGARYTSESDDGDVMEPKQSSFSTFRKALTNRLMLKRGSLARTRSKISRKAKVMSFVALTLCALGKGNKNIGIQPAEASAPIVPLPQMKHMDYKKQALAQKREEGNTKHRQEQLKMQQRAAQIEKERGPEARKKFEEKFAQKQLEEAVQKKEGLIKLKRELLLKGIHPIIDVEGERQVTLYETGVDLGRVLSTPQYLERLSIDKDPARSVEVTKADNRFVLKCIVEDMYRRGQDPLEYFGNPDELSKPYKHGREIYNMLPNQAKKMATEYRQNLETYGQITKPVEGEEIMSIEEWEAKKVRDAEEAGLDSEMNDSEKEGMGISSATKKIAAEVAGTVAGAAIGVGGVKASGVESNAALAAGGVAGATAGYFTASSLVQ